MPCQYYAVHTQTMRSDEIGAAQPFTRVLIPHCKHRQSPALLTDVRGVIGGANLLQCRGDISMCQVENVEARPTI